VSTQRVDVLIVGAGLMGAGIPRLLREAQPGGADPDGRCGRQHRVGAWPAHARRVEPEVWALDNERTSTLTVKVQRFALRAAFERLDG